MDRRQRLETLRDRFVAISLRSRTLRLIRPTRSGALDLSRLQSADESAAVQRRLLWLIKILGDPDAKPTEIAEIASGDQAPPMSRDIATLAHAARSERMATGADDLAVGWPFLEGRTSDGTWLRAPVFLYPVALGQSKRGRLRWTLEPTGPPILNEPLVHTLARVGGIRMSVDDFLQRDEDGLFKIDDQTWRGVVETLQNAEVSLYDTAHKLPGLTTIEARDRDARDGAPLDRFSLRFHLVLGRFPASASNIVLDYDALLDTELTDSQLGLASELLSVDEASDWNNAPPDTEGIVAEQVVGALSRWQALPSDASQDDVFQYLERNPSGGLVVQGPPGTGKSQLITNLISASVARGDRVLLVCQKRAALDVVADRLSKLGLRQAVAVVHDAQRDRNSVCQRVADSLSAVLDDTTGPDETLLATIERATVAHQRAQRQVRSRLEATQAAWSVLAGSEPIRPGLAELFERSLDDPGLPLPDLRSHCQEVGEDQLLDALPTIDALSGETQPLAAPHPLHGRRDWSGHDALAIDEIFERLEVLRGRVQACELAFTRGHLSPQLVDHHQPLFAESAPLLRILGAESQLQLDDFLLFWGWCGGDSTDGQWSQVVSRLDTARRELQPTPWELVAAPVETLETQRTRLLDLAELEDRWYRFFVPRYWGLRRLPERIIDSFDAPVALEGEQTLALAQLHRDAQPWQALISDMPGDSPFFDFGFQGDMGQLDEAVAKVKGHHDRVMSVHRFHLRLSQHGGPYVQRPDISLLDATETLATPFFAALVADAAKARAIRELDLALADLADHFEDDWRQIIRDAVMARTGYAVAAVTAAVSARADVGRAMEIDRLLAKEPAWVGRFLRYWRSSDADPAPASRHAKHAMEWAWRQMLLAGRERSTVEAALTDPTSLAQLAEAVDDSRALTSSGILARFHTRLLEAAADKVQRQSLQKLGADARKRRYRATLRQVIERYWDVGLSVVRPIWFCSPESVAALFPLQEGLFDLVIFDEASQCPVESAVPALVRTRRAVIAGDDQQMPPSHFFRAVTEDEFDDDDDDISLLASQSILALARIALPNTTLSWHYRCRHESLIAFSNAAFYGRRLATAPNAERRERSAAEGLHFVRVEGLWEEQTNPIEAAAVVDALATILAAELGDAGPPTVGIVTFNRKQAELIEALIEAREANDEAFRAVVQRDLDRALVDQLFVRNLENVQGDERDIIIMSVGYGPNTPGGKVHARFGPLGQDGGEKRLNVAVTRARLGLWVFASFDPQALSVGETKHPGPKLLKTYLRYVRASADGDGPGQRACLEEAAALGGSRGVTATTGGQLVPQRPGRRVRDALAAALQSRGYKVKRDLGLGRLSLDIAVSAATDDVFRLGVDCSAYLSRPDPMTRDLYVPQFWQRMGWTLLRVTPGMWAEDADAVLASVDQLIGRSASRGTPP